MEVPLYCLAIVVLILFSGFFSATETAFSTFNRIRVKNMANSGNKKAKRVVMLAENYDSLISTILIGNNIVNIAAATLGTILFSVLIENESVAGTVSTAVITVAVLLFGEVSPKTVAKRYPESFAMASAPMVIFFYYLLYPFGFLVGLFQKLVGMIFRSKNDTNITDEELITYVDEARTEGGIDEYEGELIKSAIEFDDRMVVDILTPRVSVEALEIDDEADDVLKIFRETGFSRLPVYKDSIDTIVGVLNEKDFYKVYLSGITDWSKVISKSVVYATPRLKISVLLRRLQKAKTHLAVVVDEFGGTMGIVTLEDILEELVGEIWDEHDEVIEDFVKLTDGKYVVMGDVNLIDFFDFFGVNRKGEEYEPITLSGFLVMQMGKVPDVGETTAYENLTVTVKRIEFHKVAEVEVLVGERERDDEDELNLPGLNPKRDEREKTFRRDEEKSVGREEN